VLLPQPEGFRFKRGSPGLAGIFKIDVLQPWLCVPYHAFRFDTSNADSH